MALLRRPKAAASSEFFPGFSDVVEIGQGSLSTVYRARELGTNRQVALKLLNVRDASPRALESFERESIALGAVSSHPNIVTLFRSFRSADQRPVLVLELCRASMGDRLRGGAGLPVAEVVSLGIKVAGALETAHRAEILHRDVKPQNILVTEFGEPALADFGVAMLQSSTQTTAGLFDFTTLHAAPELLEGGETSAATDVYELASTLYQLVAGRAAFRAYDGESPASVILRILRDPVQPLINSQAPTALSDLLVRAMSKDKGARPPTAVEFAGELAAVEVEQGWPRTAFLVRDAGGGTMSLPDVARPVTPPTAATPFAASPPPPVLPPPPPPVLPPPPPPVLPPPPPPVPAAPAPVVVEHEVVERIVLGPFPSATDGWSDVSLVHVDAQEPEDVPDEAPVQVVEAVEDAPDEPTEVWAPPPPSPVPDDVPRPPSAATRVVPALDSTPPPAAFLPPEPHPEPDPDPDPVSNPEPDPTPPVVPPSIWGMPDEPEAPQAEQAVAASGADVRTNERHLDQVAVPFAQYPIPPAPPTPPGTEVPAAAVPAGAPPVVPTWAYRAAPEPVQTTAMFSDLALDPLSLRNRVRLRAGLSSLTVDDAGLTMRVRLRRTTLGWAEVYGYEPRFDPSGREGHLVVLTPAGAVDLPPTRRPAGELRYVHALLDAYRQRALIMGRR